MVWGLWGVRRSQGGGGLGEGLGGAMAQKILWRRPGSRPVVQASAVGSMHGQEESWRRDRRGEIAEEES